MQTFFHSVKESSGVDEYLTPVSAVRPVLPYVSGKRVWCPFDLPDSAFVTTFAASGIPVLATHVESGGDFFQYAPSAEAYDCIVSNPPFSCRDKVLERLFELRKPFAMLLNSSGLFDSRKRFSLFAENGIELLILRGRVKFTRRSDGKANSPMFQSWYLCHGMLPKQIVFAGE